MLFIIGAWGAGRGVSQAGLLEVLARRFVAAGAAAAGYAALSLALHAALLLPGSPPGPGPGPAGAGSSPALTLLFTLQRCREFVWSIFLYLPTSCRPRLLNL